MEIIINLIIGIGSAVIASIMYEKFQAKRERKPLNTLLNFGKKDEILFIFPFRNDTNHVPKDPHKPYDLLPRTATEDFIAINNIKSALLRIHWEGRDIIKQPEGMVPSDRLKNIFSICSMKSNDFTKEVESILIAQGKPIFRVQQEGDEYLIANGDGTWPSKTYRQVDKYLANGIPSNQLYTQAYDDYGYITKITNPFNNDLHHRTKIFIVAGIRGIGTWAAAECIKKGWEQIYKKLDTANKSANFSALIKIKYDKLDIVEIKVISVTIIN
jgi:hypothetical protein